MCARLMPIRMQILLVCMVMRNIQILPAPRVGLDLSTFFADFPVFWQSKLQTETALSTMEAKIIALSACCRELFPIMDMVSSVTKSVQLPIGKLPWMSPVSIHEDNLGALVLAKTLPPQFTPRRKYYAIKTIWFCEEIFKRDVQLHKIDTVEQLGDIMTKGLTHFVFEYLRKKIMGW